MGATFDPELVEEIGAKLLAPEAKLRAASVILAPTCNIQRVSLTFQSKKRFILMNCIESSWRSSTCPCSLFNLCRRLIDRSKSFESFSEDPYLSGMIAASYVAGIQSKGIATTIKHFTYVLSDSNTSCRTQGFSEPTTRRTTGLDQVATSLNGRSARST